ncbi:MAG: hypothetical protein HYT11_00510 [Candidatus Levybacteria bacterium]|nr:hypothetical protein [Candidatus Levybacteria bacterium]
MEGEGVSIGSTGGAVSSGGGASSGGVTVGAASNAVERGFESIGFESAPVSIFEAPVPVSELGAKSAPAGEFPAAADKTVTVESGIIDSVRKEGTPEAGLQFLSDVPIDDPSEVVSLSKETPSKAKEDSSPAKPDQNDIDKPSLTPEQKSVLDFQKENPEFLNAFSNIMRDPIAIKVMIAALKKAMEDDEEEPNKDKEELSKKGMVFLLFLAMIQLATKAVEKGAKEATR